MTDDDDIRDAALFRFWCRAAQYPGGFPAETARAISHCTTADEYREALIKLALMHGVNLP